MVILVAVLVAQVLAIQAVFLPVYPQTRTLLGRQIEGTVPSECNPACANIWSITSGCAADEATCACTQAAGEAELACVDCIAAVDPSFGAQAGLTAYINICPPFNPPLILTPLAPTVASPTAPAISPPISTGANPPTITSPTTPISTPVPTPRAPNIAHGVLSSTDATSCGGSGMTISNLGINYYRNNDTLEYGVTGYTQTGISPSMSITISAYGSTEPAQIVEVCSITSCPLQGSFSFRGSQSFTTGIPSVAWSAPDLDAVATFNFIDQSGSQLGCVTATLSNGITMQASSVAIATGAATLALIVLGGIGSLIGPASTSPGPHISPVSKGAVGGNVAPPLQPLPHTTVSPVPKPLPPPPQISSLPSGAAPPIISGAGLEASGGGVVGTTVAAGATFGAFGHGPGGGYGPLSTGEIVLSSSIAGAAGMASGPGAAPTTTHAQVQGPNDAHGPPAGRMDPIALFLHFQTISSSGLLSLRYPPIYQAFTANFILPIHAFKVAVQKMRKCDLGESPAGGSSALSATAVPPVSSAPTNGQTIGIAAYAQKLGINPQDIFAIAYLVFLCACAVLLGVFLLVGLVIQIGVLTAKTLDKKDVWVARREKWTMMSSNNSLRIMTLALSALATLAFYQWTQKCTSGVTAFVSATALIIVLSTLGGVCFFILRISRRHDGPRSLFNKDSTYARRWGTLYDTLHEGSLYFVAPLLIIVLARSAITGFGQGHGLVQVCALVVLDIVVGIALMKWRPYYSRGYNRVNYMIDFTKAFSHILMIPFVESFHVNQVATMVLGVVILALNSLVALMLVGLTILKLGWGTLWYRKKHVAFKSNKLARKQTPDSDEQYYKGN